VRDATVRLSALAAGARWRTSAANGEKPADLLMQLPTKFEMTIDPTTAKSLGLTNPQSILLRTDQVIERQYSLLRCMSP
jgi:hypothetical protein